MKKRGFTLIELLAVIAILALLIMIAVPNVIKIVNNAKKDAFVSETKTIYSEALRNYVTRSKKEKVTYISSEDDTKLSTSGNNYQYCILFDTDGTILSTKISDGNSIITIDKDKNINDITTDDIVEGNLNDYQCGTKEVADAEKFDTDTWDTIQKEAEKCVSDPDSCTYKAGNAKTVDITLNGVTLVKEIRVANTSSPEECKNDDFSKSTCGFVIEFSESISQHPMNSTNTNRGGWAMSDMREYLNNEVYNGLPKALRDIIVDTEIYSGVNNDDTEDDYKNADDSVVFDKANGIVKTTDKIYLFSPTEVVANVSNSSHNINYDNLYKTTKSGSGRNTTTTVTTNTRQLDYYSTSATNAKDSSAATKSCKGKDGEGNDIDGNWYYYLRSADSRSGRTSFWGVSGDAGTSGNLKGEIFLYDANRADLCVAPVFRIAVSTVE